MVPKTDLRFGEGRPAGEVLYTNSMDGKMNFGTKIFWEPLDFLALLDIVTIPIVCDSEKAVIVSVVLFS